ncbi:SpoIIE family protein phosphatase [Pendulispora rubella]|uniref:SpoIIE family protein phosphatase n=1 Tax=Pendulispora rubella TaxID=2741070 RepID=A0ABZ2L8D7_9BACT
MTRPRHLVHRGSVLASGFVFDTRLVPEATVRARILSIAGRVSEVRRTEGQLIVRLRRPARIDAATALGAPLVSYGRLHAAMPLEPDEVRSLETGAESAVLVAGGESVSLPLEAATLEDISLWLDVASFEVRDDALSLGEIAASPAAQWVPPSEDVRAPLGVEALAADGQELMAALASPSAPSAPPRRAWLSAIWRAFAWLMTWRVPASPASSEVSTTRAPSAWFERVRAWFDGMAVRLLMWTRLAPLVGRRHAQYLQRLFDMFASNDLEGALRHAIPLNDSVAAALAKTHPALTTPSPRSDLAIVPARGMASTTLFMGDDLFSVLRQTYRRAFEALVQRGDIEKAAFVLAELLQSNEEAVAFLERHGRWTLAAEIAEARKLPPALVVRQWFLAGNKERAIRVARRTGTFAEAVSRLESSHAQEAEALRLAWADMLASSGAYAAAVDVVWPIQAARPLAREWIERGIAVGGISGAKMLVRKLHVDAAAFPEVRDRLASLIDGNDGVALATAVGQAVLAGEKRDDLRILAKMAARALMPHAHASSTLVKQLVERTGDPVFSADVRLRVPARESSVRLKAFALTRMGAAREYSEDVCIATSLSRIDPPRSGVLLDVDVAQDGVLLGAFDGTGGRAAGDIASALAAMTIAEELQRAFTRGLPNVDAAARALTAAVEKASRAVLDNATKDPSQRGSASEATVATVHGSTLLVAHVGLTRAYLLRQGELLPLTKDHTMLNDYLAKNALTPQEIADFPSKNVVMRILGMNASVTPDTVRIDLHGSDTVLLCSDGLRENLDDAALRDLLDGRSPQAAAEELLRAAVTARSNDDISIVVAQVAGDALPVKPLLEHRVAGDAGAIPIYDAAALPDGRLLVALGEVGVWLLSRDGKVLTRFAEPAHHLVLSDHGDRAILVAHRGATRRLARLDIAARKVRPWCDARIDEFADTFDGAVWYVTRDDTLFAIDVLCTHWEHLWEVHDAAFTIRSIARSPHTLSAYFRHCTELHDEIWTFEAKTHTLRQRVSVKSPSAQSRCDAAGPGGDYAGWFNVHDDEIWEAYVYNRKEWIRIPSLTSSTPAPSSANHERAAFAHWGKDGLSIRIYDGMAKEYAVFQLDGVQPDQVPASHHVRFQEDCTLVFDPWGRMLILQAGRIAREYRI